jgi:hypothetical protein
MIEFVIDIAVTDWPPPGPEIVAADPPTVTRAG